MFKFLQYYILNKFPLACQGLINSFYMFKFWQYYSWTNFIQYVSFLFFYSYTDISYSFDKNNSLYIFLNCSNVIMPLYYKHFMRWIFDRIPWYHVAICMRVIYMQHFTKRGFFDKRKIEHFAWLTGTYVVNLA